jgi:hypothetical protein
MPFFSQITVNRNLRIKILKKIAQTAVPAAANQSTTTVAGSPQTFIASDYYPTVLAFSAKDAVIINDLSNVLNNALYYSSNGKIHLQWMKSVNFNFDMSNTPSADLHNLMGFTKQVYLQLYTNNGQLDKKALSAQEIINRLNSLKYSQYLNNMSATSTNSQLDTKIGGNLKTLINNYLLQIK